MHVFLFTTWCALVRMNYQLLNSLCRLSHFVVVIVVVVVVIVTSGKPHHCELCTGIGRAIHVGISTIVRSFLFILCGAWSDKFLCTHFYCVYEAFGLAKVSSFFPCLFKHILSKWWCWLKEAATKNEQWSMQIIKIKLYLIEAPNTTLFHSHCILFEIEIGWKFVA